MAQQVVKKDGSKEPFDAEKVKKAIRTAAEEAGLPAERVVKLVEQVSGVVLQYAAGREEVTSSELRDEALGELDKVEPLVSEGWRKYDQERGR